MSKRPRDNDDQKLTNSKRPKNTSTRGNFAQHIINKELLKNKWSNFNNIPDAKIYVSATAVKNYLLNEPLLDWLAYFYNEPRGKNSSVSPKKINDDSLLKLFECGNKFEDQIMIYLKNKFLDQMCVINTDGRFGLTRSNYEKTIKCMKDGIPIIAQAVLFNDNNKTMGVADLVVRSDYINKLVNRKVFEKNELSMASNLINNKGKNVDYHYRVIEIKWTTQTLCADGITIRNEGRFPAYKGQLAIYNCAIGNIQGYIPEQAYVMSKAWKIDKKDSPDCGHNCFDLLGTVDFNGFDMNYIDKTYNAIKWLNLVRTEGTLWDPYKPHISEMYPNASNRYDNQWSSVKNNIMRSINEITQVWYVGYDNRINAHNRGITSWKDPKCNSKTLGIFGTSRPKIINSILNINRDENGIFLPKKIKNNMSLWQVSSPIDFYVDFETLNTNFIDSVNINNSSGISDYVFMIGVGYQINKVWCYKNFTTKTISMSEEERIFDEFTMFINSIVANMDPNRNYIPRLFHWSNAELTNLNHVEKRHNNKWDIWERNVKLVDMYNIFISEPIVIHGALNFKLKTIGKALYTLGLITTIWDEDGITNGFNAMFDAIKYYTSPENNYIMDAIIKYNEIDCKIIWDIMIFLRNNT